MSHGFDGESFLPVLMNENDRHREYAFFMHNNIPEGPSYPIRGVSDGRYYYSRNLQLEKLYIPKNIMGWPNRNPYWETWLFDSTENELSRTLIERYIIRPDEELYDLENDVYQMDNLIGNTDHQDHLRRLNSALTKWMNEQGDPDKDLDPRKAYEAAQRGEHMPIPVFYE